ncbi:hypothetical protein [Phormidium sp. CCY1219]|uniref:hypothetical protein n=1 Tax=Phormidium sp. CCY1219 TaxID=2886104 RepID=UPI002D1F4F55|nr:hypothetical protein [Phormidium sp. CCY1219]MEB3826211.1 hypothetical protein [Phormidium sp. CCY1219]
MSKYHPRPTGTEAIAPLWIFSLQIIVGFNRTPAAFFPLSSLNDRARDRLVTG